MLVVHGLHSVVLLAVGGTDAGFEGGSSVSHGLGMEGNIVLFSGEFI